MTAPAAWPTRKREATPHGDDDAGEQAPPARALPDQGPAGAVIREMADLLRDTRGSMLADGCILGGIAIGLALEAGLAARALRPGLPGLVNLGLLGGMVFCWLVAAFLLARAGRPVLNAVSELRWVTGAPLDPRAGWVTLPPVGADPAEWTWNRAYLLLGAARLAQVPHAVRGHVDLLHGRLLPGCDRDHRPRPVTGRARRSPPARARQLSAAAVRLIVRACSRQRPRVLGPADPRGAAGPVVPWPGKGVSAWCGPVRRG